MIRNRVERDAKGEGGERKRKDEKKERKSSEGRKKGRRKRNWRAQRLALARIAPRPLMGADGRSLPGTWNPIASPQSRRIRVPGRDAILFLSFSLSFYPFSFLFPFSFPREIPKGKSSSRRRLDRHFELYCRTFALRPPRKNSSPARYAAQRGCTRPCCR